jgi:hypothetical protein
MELHFLFSSETSTNWPNAILKTPRRGVVEVFVLSGMMCGVGCWLVTEVSGQYILRVWKGLARYLKMGPIRCPGTSVTNSKPSCVTSLKSEDVTKLNRQGKWLHAKRRTGFCRKYHSELACRLRLMGKCVENNLMCLQSFIWEIRQYLCSFFCTFQTHYHCQVMVQSDNCCMLFFGYFWSPHDCYTCDRQ